VEVVQQQLIKAHSEFVNCIIDVNSDFFATGGSDFKVNLWSKQTLSQIESFEMSGEIACLAKGPGDTVICGLINGTLASIDTGSLQVMRVVQKAHTGTVVSCVCLRQSAREILVSQDDSREFRVWNALDIGIPLIKTIGRSYNPVWYS